MYTPSVARRLHVPHLHVGKIVLPDGEAHHARDVLRMDESAPIVLFDDAGQTAHGRLHFEGERGASVVVETIIAKPKSLDLTIASAVPKGERADWMIEKLSELGVSRFIPLATHRSVVLPGGTNKRQRWERIAIESAKQCRRNGVMQIDPLQPIAEAIGPGWYLATEPGSVSIKEILPEAATDSLSLFIGPEGGWTHEERAAFDAAGLTAVRLTDTILRIETAAIVAAAVVMCIR
jgi:16S rRNA (uracil1498-N3)-methyltransferase